MSHPTIAMERTDSVFYDVSLSFAIPIEEEKSSEYYQALLVAEISQNQSSGSGSCMERFQSFLMRTHVYLFGCVSVIGIGTGLLIVLRGA